MTNDNELLLMTNVSLRCSRYKRKCSARIEMYVITIFFLFIAIQVLTNILIIDGFEYF